ncbi:LysR family transcriptional regulator [Pontibacter sp. JAM-7]|uniref:LysR family transcriptional regulator n=1 Tax=Pontibacter sp. JAM-7 TaxID=3366581 RepID=UPI003AF93F8F
MSNNISIRHLRAFSAIAACGSFTRAADDLHLTQSTLTATIQQLEQQVALTLFDRTTRRVMLTREGEQFLPVAEKLLSDFDTALNDLQAISSRQRGQVGIAASPSVITCLMPDVVHNYHQQYPNIHLQLRDENAGGIELRVLDNSVDFGIGGNHSNHPDLSYQPLLQDRYGVVLPNTHDLATKATLSWEQIAALPQLQLTTDSGIRSELQSLYPDQNLQLTQIEVSSPAAMAELIRRDMGICLLPALAANTRGFSGLVFSPLEPEFYRQIYLISRRGRALSPAAEAMLQNLLLSLQQQTLPTFVERI